MTGTSTGCFPGAPSQPQEGRLCCYPNSHLPRKVVVPPQVLSLLEGETPHPVLTQWSPAWGPRACKKCSPGAAESGSV